AASRLAPGHRSISARAEVTMNTGLKDLVAIVAASSKGIGRAAAFALATEGAKLALCARSAEALDETADQIRAQHGVEVHTEAFDVSDDARVRAFADAAHQRFGRIDVCVTNAGGPPAKPFAETTMD